MVMFYHAEGCRCGHRHAAPPAGAYPEGPDYAAGKDKAHFEVRALAEGPPHGSGCGCDPCRTIGAVLAAWRGRCAGGT